MSRHTQIALDFGPEEHSPPPAPAENGGRVEEPTRPYMAAGGVGVRIKSYKQTPAPQPGDLFGEPAGAIEPPAPVAPAAIEPAAIEPAESIVNQSVEQAILPETAPAGSAPAETASAQFPTPQDMPALEEAPVRVLANEEPAAKASRPTAAKPAAAKPVKQGPSKRGRKSLKQVAAEADLIDIPADEVLFSKQYYTMGEVAEMFRVNQSLLRFWETEFDILQPKKNKKGDRYFRPIDIKNLHLIYHLLRQKKYTIEGAKEFLKKNKKAEHRFEIIQRLQEIKAFLQEMKAQL